DFVRNAQRRIFVDLLDSRLSAAARRSGGEAYTGASLYESELASDYFLLSAGASFEGEAWAAALESLRAQIALVARDGFLESELERLEKDYAIGLEDVEKNGRSSDAWVSRLADAFERGATTISDADRRRLYDVAFDGLDESKLMRYAKQFEEAGERIVFADMPESPDVPSADELASAVASSPVALSEWVDEGSSALFPAFPRVVSPIAEREEAGSLVLSYANGIVVALRRTEHEPDQIVMTAYAPRGTDRLDYRGYANALIAAALVPGSGFDGLSPEGLKDALAGINAGLEASLTEETFALSGSSDRAGLETLLQLVRRTLSDPVIDGGYLSMVKKSLVERARNFRNDPESVFQLEMSKRLYPASAERDSLFTETSDVELLDAELARDSFLSLASPPGGLRLAFAGSYDEETLRGLC
ncbi:MAG: hypothetical protein Q8M76_01590, partial [Spirochaetaceae bacterium]|nr:hypothetical protein [Spirochaetaceae bacterium]